jgi:hypothetical protein
MESKVFTKCNWIVEFQLNRALARVWGNSDCNVDYDAVVADALLDQIGAQGWSTIVSSDVIRFQMDLEDLGKVGLLLVSGGHWDGLHRYASHWRP